MKIEFEILPDQMDLLQRIKELPALIENNLGKLPMSFPGGSAELARIRELCESLEFKWKKWVLDQFITRFQPSCIFKDIRVCPKDEYLDEEDC